MAGPPAGKASVNHLAFGPFRLDLRSGELQREGAPVEIAALPARLLRYLAANRGRTIAKDELAREIWHASYVGEATIQQAVRAVRRAVGDDGRAQRIIETASGVGYRFVAPVEGDAASSPPIPEIPLVGRRALVDACEAGLTGLRSGRGSVLLLSGAAGIGKSRLLDEIERLASSRALLVVRGGERPPEGALPFWPWVDLFRELAGARPLDALRTRAPHLLGIGAEGAAPSAEPERFRHFDVAARSLHGAALLGPVVVLLEDLHRAGLFSWELLERVAATALAAPLFVVATFRNAEIGSDPHRSRVRGRIASLPRSRELEIEPLSDVESAYLVELASGRPVPSEHVPAIASGIGGSPLAAIELARLLPGDTRPAVEADWQGLIGQSLARLLETRLADLGAELRSALATAAAIGTSFEIELLTRASAGGEQPMRALEIAVEKRFVSELRPGTGVYRFSHALVRDSLYADLARDLDRSRAVHLRIADALALMDPGRHSELAHHTCAAGPVVGSRRIVASVERAARDAAQGGEIDGAFDFYERGLGALDEIEPVDAELRCVMLVAAGELGVRGSRPEAAREFLDEAIALARRLARFELLARASLARAHRTEIVGSSDAALIALLDEAITGLGDTRPALTAQLRSRSAVELRYASDGLGRAQELVNRAASEAQSSGDPGALARVLEDASLIHWSVADPEAWLDLNARIVKAARAARDTELLFQGYKGLATAQLELCRRTDFDREVDRCAATAEEYPSPFLLAVVAGLRASQAFLDGDFERAEAKVLEAAASGIDDLAQLAAAQIFFHRLETGRAAELEAATRQFVQDTPGIATWPVALARLLIDDGRLDEARELLSGLPPLAGVARDRNWFITMAVLAECAAALEDRELGARVFAQLEPHATTGVVLGNATVFFGTGAHYLGMLQTLLGRPDEADLHLELALKMHTDMRSEPWRLHTQLEQARALVVRGDGVAASHLAASVARHSEALGMVRCARAAETIASGAR